MQLTWRGTCERIDLGIILLNYCLAKKRKLMGKANNII